MRIWHCFLNMLFPPKCVFCGELLDRCEIGICSQCQKTLPYTKNGGKQKADFMIGVFSALYYEGNVRRSLHRYKFLGVSALAESYAPLLAEVIQSELCNRYDVLTWVPISRKRLRQRGFDQAQLLAEKTAKCLGVEPVSTLKKVRNVPPQSKAGAAEQRRANISGCYSVVSPSLVQGKRILILDDIVTTGSTLSECARMLLLSGAESVVGAALARHRD